MTGTRGSGSLTKTSHRFGSRNRGLRFIGLSLPLLSACVIFIGEVSTATYSEIASGARFVITKPDRDSLTERNIQRLISKELQSLGLRPAASGTQADLEVRYSYSIGSGKTVVSSNVNQATGKTEVISGTHFPRYLEISIHSLAEREERPGDLVWQGELYSQGSSANISYLADRFVPLIFKNFSRDVTNKRFRKLEFRW